MTSAQRTILGLGMLAAGLLLTLIAASLIWGGVQRWLAVDETHDAFDQLRRGRVEDARKLARKAAARVPGEPAPALLAVDPKDAEALEGLVTLALRAPRHADKQALLAAVGLLRLAAGKPPAVELSGTADGRLLTAIAAVRQNQDPGKLKPVADEEPPHLAVLRAAHTVLLRRAWQLGRVSEVRQHAGALLLMRPRGGDAGALRFLLAASSPTRSDAELMGQVGDIKDDREAVLRATAALLPQRRAAIGAQHPKAVEGLP